MPAPLILLHGALGSAAQMDPLRQILGADRPVSAINFPGHGGTTLPEGGYRMAVFTEALEREILTGADQPVDIFGYSMGGYVALALALRRPGLIRSITTLGTKWIWDPEIARREVGMLDPETIREKVPSLADLIAHRHQPQPWETVVRATAALLLDLGEHPLLPVDGPVDPGIPVRILLGGRDRMVGQEESEAMATRITGATFSLLEDQPHPFEHVDMQVLALRIRQP